MPSRREIASISTWTQVSNMLLPVIDLASWSLFKSPIHNQDTLPADHPFRARKDTSKIVKLPKGSKLSFIITCSRSQHSFYPGAKDDVLQFVAPLFLISRALPSAWPSRWMLQVCIFKTIQQGCGIAKSEREQWFQKERRGLWASPETLGGTHGTYCWRPVPEYNW